MSIDNMVTSLVLCRRCNVRRDGVSGSNDNMSAENDNSGDCNAPGEIVGVSAPPKRWTGVCPGDVMSRVIIGGVAGKSSTTIAGMSAYW
jgi:hypothetical protein